MLRSLRVLARGESAQVLPLFAMLTLVLIGLLGLATDIGRIYVARAQLGRAVDAAALAGAKQLPDLTAADAKARAYITENDPDASVNVSVYPDVQAQQVSVVATKRVKTVFMKVLGITKVDIQNDATAGFGVVPVDAVMAIDATGSMGANPPCNGSQNNSGCPIWEAKNAATSFTNTLLPSANTVVGNTAFRGCYNPPDSNAGCVPTNTIGYLTGDKTALDAKIASMSAVGGTGTNVCNGLDKAASILFGAGSHSASNNVRIIVILTDGDNTYNAASYVAGSSPVAACTPNTSPSTSQTYLGTSCSASGQGSASSSNPGSNSEQKERELDTKTLARADALKALGVEIYVVGFGVCGSDDGTVAGTSYCSAIGGTQPDTFMDQRVAKCIASSTPGTNDHFFRANTATELPGIFNQIAQQIAFRLIK